jgi:hypothetical protein
MNIKKHTSTIWIFVLCFLLFFVSCDNEKQSKEISGDKWKLVEQWKEPYKTEQIGSSVIAKEDGQEIYSLQQEEKISQTFSATLELNVPILKVLNAQVGYQLSLDTMNLSGTSVKLQKGQKVTFYLQNNCDVYLFENTDTNETHKVYNRSKDSISFAWVIEENGEIIKDTRKEQEPEPVKTTTEKSITEITTESIQNSRWSGSYDNNGELSGYGTYNYDNGVYTGYFEKGLRNGQGTYTWADGEQYVGTWVNGEENGRGTFTWTDGNEYVGDFVNGERTGQGTFTWAYGNKYVGDFVNGERTGRGTFTWASGHKFIGTWENGEEIEGTRIFPDGTTQSYSKE